jgi:ribosomal-protein-alanine N-acetyltransferase
MNTRQVENTVCCEALFTIRPMQQGDLAQVRAIDQASFTMPWPESAYNYELNQNPLSLLWVAVSNAASGADQDSLHILGMVVVWMILDEVHIATIAVHPEYRQKGIAQCLLAEALKGAIGRGAREATLEVRISNIAARKLYERFRFEIVGERRRYYRDNNEDALIMTVSGLDNNYLAWLESGDWKQKRCFVP